MATLKLTLDTRRQYSDCRSPLILRLTQNGKSTSIHLGVKLLCKEWDSKKQKILKKHPNQIELNLYLKNTVLDFEQKLRNVESSKTNIDLVELKERITSKESEKEFTFYQFAMEQIEYLRLQDRYGNAQSYLTATNNLIEYGGKKVMLTHINYSFIIGFESYLSVKGVSVNGIAVYMRAIRALLNKGGKMECYDMKNYPFKKFKIRTEKTVSRAEILEKFIELNQLKLEEGNNHFDARNIFLLIFGLIGISFMDLILLKKANLKNGRVIYRRRKTGKLYSIKTTPLVEAIFNQYTTDSNDYLLPQFGLDGVEESKVRQQVNLGLKSTNRYLKKLGEQINLTTSLTTYVARYSWANIAKSNGYSKDLIAEALGHSYGNAVTGIYLEGYGNQVIDSANEKIVSLLTPINYKESDSSV